MSITIGQADPAWVSPLVNFLAVVLGGLLTWATTRHFEQKRQRNQDHALAYALVFKIQSLTDEIWKIDREIKNAIKRAAAENFHGPLWAILDEIIGLDESLERISAEELTLVARTKDADLVIKIREIESGHTILKMVLAKIHELRASPDLRKHAKSVKGRVVSFAGNQEEFPAIAHIFICLDDLSGGLGEMSDRVSKNAKEVAVKIGGHLKSYYRLSPFISLSAPPDMKTDS